MNIIKLKATNEKTNLWTQTTVWLLPEGKGAGVGGGDGDEEGKEQQIYGDRRRLDFGGVSTQRHIQMITLETYNYEPVLLQ